MTLIYLNQNQVLSGGPQVWLSRFGRLLLGRGYQLTNALTDSWDAALFVNKSGGLDRVVGREAAVGYRVANAYMPQWFEAMGKQMKPSHFRANGDMARALELAGRVVYQSAWAKAQLDELLFRRESDFEIIPNGVDLIEFSRSEQEKQRNGIPVIGSVGALRYRYRLETVFEMSKRLEFDHRLLIVGSLDKSSAQVLGEYRRDPAVGSRISYHEAVPPERLPAFYRQMSLLAHPVCGDACPNVVVEALACGVPVVAPRFGGTAELVGEAGAIFECEPWKYDQAFAKSMAAAAAKVLAQGEEMGLAARRRAEEKLDAEVMVDRYLTLLGLPARLEGGAAAISGSGMPWRAKAARAVARPRFYAAVAVGKLQQARRRLRPHAPNSKPRIAFTLFDFHVGGIENWLYRLARELGGEFDFYFLATRVPDFLPKFAEVGACEYTPDVARMVSALQRNRVDLVQVHNQRWPVDAALAAGVSHIIERLGGQRSWRRVPKYGISAVISSAAGGVDAMAGMMPSDRVHLVYNGMPLDEVDQAQPQRLFGDDAFVIGRTTRFGQGQNLGMLVEAMARMRPHWPELRLVLVGDDSLMPGATPVADGLKRRVREQGLADVVRFTGIVEDTLPLVHGFEVGTCVSNDEGIPNSLIEAMACRKPVISTRVGAVEELVRDGVNGLLIEKGDVGGLCGAIERLLRESELRQRLGEAGRQTVEERFSLAAAADRYGEIYRQVMAE